ncbi:replication-associated protein [Crucivirus-345]|nr:replication-associated protein [Crucivirus-345]
MTAAKACVYERQWCYTWNNFTCEDYASMKEWCEKYCTWWIMGIEKGEEGTPHIQGAFRTKNTRTFKNLKNKFGKVHWEMMKGTCQQSLTYCSKGGNFEVGGKLPAQGKRQDLDNLKDAIIKDSVKLDDIICKMPMLYHQYGRTLEKLEDIALRKKSRTEMTEGIWYWGKTAVGKSHLAFEGYHPSTHYLLSLEDKGWWEGYNGQDTVIINDFRGEIKYSELLQLIDKWPYNVTRRNRGTVPFISKRVIITSSLPPDKCYRHRQDEDCIEQLLRRLKVVELVKEPMKVPLAESSGSGRSGQGNTIHDHSASATKKSCICDATFCECI